MHKLQTLVVTAAVAVVTAGIVPSMLVEASDCRVEDLDAICMGEGSDPAPAPIPPGGWTCYVNSAGIFQQCKNAQNEPDGGYCVDSWGLCAWQYWLACGTGPDSDKWWDDRMDQTSYAAGMVGDCEP